MTDAALSEAAARALACLDLTDLSEDASNASVRDLCARAVTRHGPVAAVCIWPQFVPVAKTALTGTGVRIATVVAFPTGDDEAGEVIALTEKAITDGADEIDVVIPYKGLLEGHPELVPARVARVKDAAFGATVKAILETGVLGKAETIREAASLAIEGGADFIKTSTGKVPINATPEAARVMLEVIAGHDRTVGLKPAGGVRTAADAKVYIDLAEDAMGEGWATPAHFRIGASSVLEDLLAVLDGAPPGTAAGGGDY